MKGALLTLLCTLSALAQWPTDPAQNLLICDHTGEQALPKIAATSDGGCYITWWDLASGNYDVYLQRLNADGVPQWTNPCGILVSDHPHATWLTDWDIAVDANDNCVIAVNDTRNGDDRDITAYLIGPQQEFLWGADGIAISNNDGFEPDPRIAIAENGDIVFAWQEENTIHLRRVTTNGDDVFTPPTITITATYGVSIPRIVAADSNSVILSYLVHQGTPFTSPRHIYMQKFAMNGTMMWNPAGVAVMTTNGIGVQMRPDLVYDGQGGAYSYWYDTRNSVHHCYVQRINSAGVVQWTANGVNVDVSANELQMSPSAVNTGFGIVIFYQTANPNQSLSGVDAQYVSPTGQLNWNSNGVTIVPLSSEPSLLVKAFVQNGNYSVCFSQYAPSSNGTLIRASQLGETGQFTWSPIITDLCNVDSEKGRPHYCVNSLHQILAAWPDSRSAVMDIYVQNVNSSGSLGPLAELPPSISITFPAENDTVHNDTISLVFDVDHFDLDPNSGEGSVWVIVNGAFVDTLYSEDPYPVEILPGLNQIQVVLLDEEFFPLDPVVTDFVEFYYPPLNPSITITNPTQDTTTFTSQILVSFSVVDFVVGDSMGDGHIHVQDISPGGNDTITFEHFSLNPIPIDLICPFDNHICISLVDNQGNQLDPMIFDCVTVLCGEIAADPVPDLLPQDFSIVSTYPNPFNSAVSIDYDVPRPTQVALEVFDVTGRKVSTLVNAPHGAGRHRVTWTAETEPSGLYFVRLTGSGRTVTGKLVLLK